MRLSQETSIWRDEVIAAGINGAQTTANGKNTVYYAPTEPSGGTYTNGDIWFDTDDGNAIYVQSSTSSAWVKQELGADAIADLAITNAKIANLDGGKITAGSVSTAQLAAGSISTEKLAIGDFTNYATVNENYPNSMNTTADTETVVDSTTGMVTKKVATQRYTPLVTAWGANPFKSGDQVAYSLKAKGAAAGTVNLRMVGFNANRESLGNVGASLSLTTETQTFSGTFTMPALFNNAAFYSITIYDGRSPASQIYYSEAKFYKKVSGDLIVDGAITADKLDANAINGKTITGSTIQTIAEPLKLFNLRGWSGTNTVEDKGTSSTENLYNMLRAHGLGAKNAADEFKAQLIPCKFSKTIQEALPQEFTGDNAYGWYLDHFLYAPMLLTNWGVVVTWTDLDGALHDLKDEIIGVTETTVTFGTNSLIRARVGASGTVVTLIFNFTMAANTATDSTAYQLPLALRPSRQIDCRCTNTQIRFHITTDGYIRPHEAQTASRAIRGTVTYVH